MRQKQKNEDEECKQRKVEEVNRESGMEKRKGE